MIDAATDSGTPFDIVAVISNRPDAAGLQHAERAQIAGHVVDHTAFTDRPAFERALAKRIDTCNADVIVLAGFMRILTEWFVNRYHGRLINIHPSLLPKFRGLDTHSRAIEAGETAHGASVHYVTATLDGGPLIAQIQVPLQPADTAESLAARVLEGEHLLYPTVVRWIAEDRVALTDNGVSFDGALLQAPRQLELALP